MLVKQQPAFSRQGEHPIPLQERLAAADLTDSLRSYFESCQASAVLGLQDSSQHDALLATTESDGFPGHASYRPLCLSDTACNKRTRNWVEEVQTRAPDQYSPTTITSPSFGSLCQESLETKSSQVELCEGMTQRRATHYEGLEGILALSAGS